MDACQHQGSKNRILSVEQTQQVNDYARRLLEEVDSKMECEEALDILGHSGCDISDTNRVKIPRNVVMEAIDAAASEIEVYDRNGNPGLVLKENACFYGTGSDCNKTIDLETHERRICRKDDVGRFARFCDALPKFDFIMSFGIANNIPKGANFVHQYEAMIINTAKLVIVTGHSRNDMTTMVRIASEVTGGIENLSKEPPLILYTEPICPLVHTELGVGKGIICWEYGIPFIYIGSPMMGGTAPATIEGTLVQSVAESLAALVIFQNKQPGAKFIFVGDATVMDMQSSIFSYGGVELNLLNAGLADMGHY